MARSLPPSKIAPILAGPAQGGGARRLLPALAGAYDPVSRSHPAIVPDLPIHRGTPSQVAVPSSAEREHVVELLTQHFAQDRISIEEFERRVTLVYAAPDRPALHALLADLQPTRDALGASSGALVSDDDRPAEVHVRALMSSTGRSGPQVMPRFLRVTAVMGNVELDLRSASFATGVTVIDVHAVMGNVEITVLPDVPVEIIGGAVLGAFHVDGRNAAASTSPQRRPLLVRVTGRAVLANVEVRYARPEEPMDGW